MLIVNGRPDQALFKTSKPSSNSLVVEKMKVETI
jgi:hypothetical protein